MNRRSLILIAGSVAALYAQPRRAEMTGGGGDRGKCTIEVVIDGAAEVEVRGDTAFLRNLEGRPPQWRRFVCNRPLPANPADFRFAGVDGRRRQSLMRDARDGGVAVIRIEDPDNGSEGYTFDLFWRGGYGPPPTVAPDRGYDRGYDRGRDRDRDDEDYHREREDYYRGNWRERFFERVRDDLEHAARASFPRGEDRYRLADTHRELDEL